MSDPFPISTWISRASLHVEAGPRDAAEQGWDMRPFAVAGASSKASNKVPPEIEIVPQEDKLIEPAGAPDDAYPSRIRRDDEIYARRWRRGAAVVLLWASLLSAFVLTRRVRARRVQAVYDSRHAAGSPAVLEHGSPVRDLSACATAIGGLSEGGLSPSFEPYLPSPLDCNLTAKEHQCGWTHGRGECVPFREAYDALGYDGGTEHTCFWLEYATWFAAEHGDDEERGICRCSGNYDGLNCRLCLPGWTGADCNTRAPLRVRRNLSKVVDSMLLGCARRGWPTATAALAAPFPPPPPWSHHIQGTTRARTSRTRTMWSARSATTPRSRD